MSHFPAENTIIPLDPKHLCNHCTNRNPALLEGQPTITKARHTCGVEKPPLDRITRRNEDNALVQCTEYFAGGVRCVHGTGVLNCELDECLCAGGEV